MTNKRNNSVSEVLHGIGCLPMIVSVIFLCLCILNIRKVYNDIVNGDVKLLSLLFCAILFIVLYVLLMKFSSLRDKYDVSIRLIKEQSDKHQKELEQQFKKKEEILQESIIKKESDIQCREKIVEDFVNSLDKEKYCAELISDFRTTLYEQAATRLANKYYAAPVAAETVRQLRAETRKYIEELKQYKYKEEERISRIKSEAQIKVNQAMRHRDEMRREVEQMKSLLASSTPFKDVAELYADTLAVVYGEIAQELREKTRPAVVTAEDIERKLKKRIREEAYKSRVLRYRWDSLLAIFPDLEKYVDNDEDLLSIGRFVDADDFIGNRDKAYDYLSTEEYNRLSDVEKYQLALDRYKQHRKSTDWIAGAEYEMYCCHVLRMKGFSVIDNGIQKGRLDNGIDIIAQKDDNTFIIQCKRYTDTFSDGTDKFIHENIICQLYGAAKCYQMDASNNQCARDVVPTLLTTGRLSETAIRFAKILHVMVVKCSMGEYPMIKCNVNNGEKIYHLPFDQQYWNTRIQNPGEFYAWTVDEAERAGFRRAKRWLDNNNS